MCASKSYVSLEVNSSQMEHCAMYWLVVSNDDNNKASASGDVEFWHHHTRPFQQSPQSIATHAMLLS